MGSSTHCSNLGGFVGTHGTHVNEATVEPAHFSALEMYLYKTYISSNLGQESLKIVLKELALP